MNQDMKLFLLIFVSLIKVIFSQHIKNFNSYGNVLAPKPAIVTPCCVDTLTPGVCRSMLANDHENFINMCRKNADFSFMQCCYTCHFTEEAYAGLFPSGADLYNEDATKLLLNPANEFHKCFDRHSNKFCELFLARRGRWALRQITCEHSSLAFRICRKTCGFCTSFLTRATVNYNGTEARDMKKCAPLFLHNCVHNADFAFIQCCKSCFDLKSSFSLNLDYEKVAQTLLADPATAICDDRRGEVFCEQLVRRKHFWGFKKFKKLDCSSMPFAFRVCRMSCGYCSSGTRKAGAIYNYEIATDPSKCNNPAYGLALLPVEKNDTIIPRESPYSTEGTIPPPIDMYSTEGTIPPPVEESTYPPVPEEATDSSIFPGEITGTAIPPDSTEYPSPFIVEEHPIEPLPNFEAWWSQASPVLLKNLLGSRFPIPKYDLGNDQLSHLSN
ncbi:hypothetical protein FO519_005468 [Halicephalobus sp. NKZ332]|nr:hypothetical protein FO519_005468 [Halicephalobus sp. NKZ332]